MAGEFERGDLIVDTLLRAAVDFASPDGVHDTTLARMSACLPVD
jgi:hypothetical protein